MVAALMALRQQCRWRQRPTGTSTNGFVKGALSKIAPAIDLPPFHNSVTHSTFDLVNRTGIG